MRPSCLLGETSLNTQHCIYQAVCGIHTYLGRAAVTRASSRHGAGPAWCWKEHTWSLLLHRMGTVGVKHRRLRYYKMLGECIHATPGILISTYMRQAGKHLRV